MDVAIDSTFIHAYSRRKRKAGVSDRGARVGKVERTTYALGWRVHTVATQERLPLTYMVRQANVNDKVPAPKLLIEAVRLLHRAGLSIRLLIADAQYYWREFFKLSRWLGIKPVIPAPPQIKRPIINLRVKHGFIAEGDPELVRQYHKRMIVEHVFKHGNERFEPRQPKMERSSKGSHACSPMLLSHSSRGDNSTQDGKTRTNTQHKSIPVTKKNFSQVMRANL